MASLQQDTHISRTERPPVLMPFRLAAYLPVGEAHEYFGADAEIGWRQWDQAVGLPEREQLKQAGGAA